MLFYHGWSTFSSPLCWHSIPGRLSVPPRGPSCWHPACRQWLALQPWDPPAWNFPSPGRGDFSTGEQFQALMHYSRYVYMCIHVPYPNISLRICIHLMTWILMLPVWLYDCVGFKFWMWWSSNEAPVADANFKFEHPYPQEKRQEFAAALYDLDILWGCVDLYSKEKPWPGLSLFRFHSFTHMNRNLLSAIVKGSPLGGQRHMKQEKLFWSALYQKWPEESGKSLTAHCDVEKGRKRTKKQASICRSRFFHQELLSNAPISSQERNRIHLVSFTQSFCTWSTWCLIPLAPQPLKNSSRHGEHRWWHAWSSPASSNMATARPYLTWSHLCCKLGSGLDWETPVSKCSQ